MTYILPILTALAIAGELTFQAVRYFRNTKIKP
jgi:hypothetical protein